MVKNVQKGKSAYGTAVVSISLPVDFLVTLEDEASLAGQNRSSYMRYLLRMGRVYVHALKEREQPIDDE